MEMYWFEFELGIRWGLGGYQRGGLGGWGAKAGWGGVQDLANSACVTFMLQAGERRELAANLPLGQAFGSGRSLTAQLGYWPHFSSAFLKVRAHVISGGPTGRGFAARL